MNHENRNQDPERSKRLAAMLRLCWVMEYRRLESVFTQEVSEYGSVPIPRWDGGVRNGRRHEPIWPKLAEYCDREQLDPLIMVRSFFATKKCIERPSPDMLMGSKVRAEYYTAQSDAEARLRESLWVHVGVLRTEFNLTKVLEGLDEQDAWRVVLRKPTESTRPMLWYGTVLELLGPVAAEPFHDGAFRDYLYNHLAYDSVWSEFVPDRFRRDATALFSALRNSSTGQIPVELSPDASVLDSAAVACARLERHPARGARKKSDSFTSTSASNSHHVDPVRLRDLIERIGLGGMFNQDRQHDRGPDCIIGAGEFLQGLWHGGDAAEAAAHWSSKWHITAVGNRPTDHMARDLMHGSLLRNPCARWFQRIARDAPDWIAGTVVHLPPAMRAQAEQHVALRMMHLRHLYSLSQSLPGELLTRPNLALFESLVDCRPFGVEVAWRGEAEWIHDFSCKCFRLCPWCLARKAIDLYGRLRRRLKHLRNGEGNHLLLARIEVTRELLAADRRPGSMIPLREGESWFGHEFRHVRQHWGSQLREWARRCGAVGGLLVHQVGPHGNMGGPIGYLHDLAVLAEVPTTTARQLARLERAAGIGTDHRPYLGTIGHKDPAAHILAAMMPAEHHQALRYLWTGTSARFELRRASIATNGNITDGWGLDGAMRLLPWFLFNQEQWTTYTDAIRGRHLAVPFGSWVEALRRPAASKGRVRDAPCGSARREAAFHAQNRANAEQAHDKRDEALALARPVYYELSRRSRRRVGRGQLIEAMERAGHPIEERVARDLIPILRNEFHDRSAERNR